MNGYLSLSSGHEGPVGGPAFAGFVSGLGPVVRHRLRRLSLVGSSCFGSGSGFLSRRWVLVLEVGSCLGGGFLSWR